MVRESVGLKKKRERDGFRLDWVRAKVFFRRVGIWIKSSGGYFRETSLFLPPHRLFINYLGSLSIILFK